ncbi:MAG TPA: hypothetical protein VIU39_02600 [Anaerolineales bacterium]
MRLIERYVTEVGRHLPLVRGRGDIQNELRSTLQDMLEDKARKAGRPADEAMEMDLLREYGAPDKVASSYNPMPYVIGPRMYPFYTMVLKIAVSVQAVVLLVLLGIRLATQPPLAGVDVLSGIGTGLAGVVSATISAFGMITLVFAIIERYAPSAEIKMDEDEKWDPASLLKEPEPEDVKMWEPVVEIVGTAIALSIFNFNRDWIGFYFLSDGRWSILPVLTDAFFRWMPLINITWVSEIVLNALLLQSGRWTVPTRLTAMAIKLMQIAIGFFLLTGPTILAITPESLQATGVFPPDAAQTLGTMAQQGVRSVIAVVMFVQGIDVVKMGVRLVRRSVPALA